MAQRAGIYKERCKKVRIDVTTILVRLFNSFLKEVPITQNFHTSKPGEITVFFPVFNLEESHVSAIKFTKSCRAGGELAYEEYLQNIYQYLFFIRIITAYCNKFGNL